MEDDRAFVTKAIRELPFPVGRRLLCDVLAGNAASESVMRNRLFRLSCFGSMAYSPRELDHLIEGMLTNGLIEYKDVNGHVKGLFITEKGGRLPDAAGKPRGLVQVETHITDDDRRIFEAFAFFLCAYTDEQKKAITCPSDRILCIAGAGSGKTEVLTKRISFLMRFCGVDPKSILAITFTRKARTEMASRIEVPVDIETFNSFCEKTLLRHNDLAYNRRVRVLSFGDKVRLIRAALARDGLDLRRAVAAYFTTGQRKGKTDEELASIFMNDCFFLRMHADLGAPPQSLEMGSRLAFAVAHSIDTAMRAEGLRDYDDQIIDCLALFRAHGEVIPRYSHVLVDEYQDINARQQEMIDALSPANLFVVGDPRQGIFGWRGSRIEYIMGFPDRHPGCEIISLTRNHRSSEAIVSLCNAAIRAMKLPDLISTVVKDKDMRLIEFENEDAEAEFVIQRITASGLPFRDVFILARTNRQLTDMAERLAARGIPYTVRSEEIRRNAERRGDITETLDAVTVATVHAIKGMEARMVFVIGANANSFPCRASDHPVIDLVREDYDRDEEERRLFYVALSRAKESLYVTFAGKPTRYLTDEMKEMLGFRGNAVTKGSRKKETLAGEGGRLVALKEWRREKASLLGVAPYLVLHDRTIEELAGIDAIDLEDLEGVYGIGPAKLQRYGREILEVMNCRKG